MNIENKPWHVAAVLTVVMSIATGLGNFVSSSLLLSVKHQEEMDRTEIERKAKGAQLHCEKLREAASLAAEIEFSADRGYPNIVRLSDLTAGATVEQLKKVPDQQIVDEQLAYEKRASALSPLMTTEEAIILNHITLHHFVVTQMRTSKVPVEQRVSPNEGGFNANNELDGIRSGAATLAAAYRLRCTEAP
ncbi:hypothetical protein [Pseudomonas fluorescens]|uniref:hypothetical protein n=1 Tax=Pseudomonas fluorescens TaxID=294 RepID=UPI003D23B34B